ncbi:MAG TPA: peptide chain release factor 1 [Firmicutes bacterium]|nr:peptide chain release factor 1 [Candidatus Fermentithermobacillaceae bacterium]
MSTAYEGATFAGKLDSLVERYDFLTSELEKPEVFSDPKKYRQLATERARIEGTVDLYKKYLRVLDDIAGSREILETEEDKELRKLAEEELASLEETKAQLEKEIRLSLVPKDPNDDKNVIMEIRAGTGGEEAALFAAELFRMYGRYAEDRRWKLEVLTSSPTDLGGFKEIIFAISGKGAYRRLKHEGGVHRVQRIPATESGGRIHTSTATVAVLPESEEVDDIEIDPDDLRIDTYCSSGKGGQGVNTTYSAVRITHLPTGLVVTCQDERSQLQNKERAMRILKSRLLALAQEQRNRELTQARRSQVGTGERAEKIRTYNFPQNRVTDHRIGYTTHRLTEFLDGDIDELIDALLAEEDRKRLEEASQV